MHVRNLADSLSFVTVDGSSIRELAGPLTLLCCCAPAYRHEDTVLTEEPADAR